MGDTMVPIAFLRPTVTISDPWPQKKARKIARLDNYRLKSCWRGLYQLPIAAFNYQAIRPIFYYA